MSDLSETQGRGHPGPADSGRPRVAVLLPVFNDQAGLAASLASLTRDGAECHVFVVDDGSDPPISIPRDFPHQARLIRMERNQGITEALNTGLAVIADAGYKYVARLDAGDLSLPGRLAAQMEFLDRCPRHAAVGTAIRHVDMQGNLLFEYRPPTENDALVRALRYRAAIVHPSVMFRMEALRACGPYRNTFPGGEDYDLFLRLSHVHKLANLPAVLVVKEVNPNSLTSRKMEILVSRLRILACHFDARSMHSYLGMVTNLLFLLTPRRLVFSMRRLRGRWRPRVNPPEDSQLGRESSGRG